MTAQTPPPGGTQTQPVGGSEGTGLGTRADGIGHAAPAGYTTVTPWVISSDTGRLIEFVQEAFGAHELARVPGPDGRVGHAEVRIGDAVVMMFDRAGDWPDTPGFLRLYVEDADLVYQRALAGHPGHRAVLRGPGRPRPGSAGQHLVDPGPRRGRRPGRAGPAPP
jgi:hypothetical protein